MSDQPIMVDLTKRYKFLAGPYKGLVFRVISSDAIVRTLHIQLVQYDKPTEITLELFHDATVPV